jgi:hypothetical protein
MWPVISKCGGGMNEGMDMRSRALICINRIYSDKYISERKIVRPSLPTLSASAHNGLHFAGRLSQENHATLKGGNDAQFIT